MSEHKVKKFSAKINPDGADGAWPTLKIPFDVKNVWGTGARVSVKGMLNGFEFRSSIFPQGDGTHHLMVNKQMRAGARVEVGDTVKVMMEKDDAPREAEVPEILAKALNKNKTAKAIFEKLPPSHKKEYIGYITEAKKEVTRLSRVEKTITALLEYDKTKKKK